MVTKIILLVPAIVILLLNFYQLQKLLTYNNHRILLTTIPYTEKDDPQVQAIVSQAKRRINIVRFLSFAALVLYLLPGNEALPILIFIFHMFVLQILLFLALQPCFIQLRHWKASQSTGSTFTPLMNKDKEHFVNSRPFPLYAFLLPLILICCGVGYGYSCSLSANLLFVISLLGIAPLLPILLFFSFHRSSFDNLGKDISSADILSRENGKLSFFFSTLEALCFFVFCLFYCRNIYSSLPLYLYLGSIFLLQVLQWIFLRQNRQYCSSITQENRMDDEWCYDLWGYSNPNDRRMFVPSLISNGSFLVNRGNLKGKMVITIFSLTMVLLMGSFVRLLWTDDVTVTFTSQNLSLRAFPYSDEIPLRDISSVTLLPQLPSEHLVRTNGAGFSSKRYGSFTMEGVGDVRLYLFNNPPYLEIKSCHSQPIYLNTRNPKETLQLYEKLHHLLAPQ